MTWTDVLQWGQPISIILVAIGLCFAIEGINGLHTRVKTLEKDLIHLRRAFALNMNPQRGVPYEGDDELV